MVQLRLAWWRDRLAEPSSQWPKGEPLLAILPAWDGERAALAALVDGHEAACVGEDGGVALTAARAGSIMALARMAGLGDHPLAPVVADAWARGVAPPAGLPRALRPVALLDHLATDGPPWRVLLGAVRKGWLGR